MAEATADFSGLMARARSGCPRALEDLYRQYGDHVRRIVRRRLHQRLRAQYDSIDFMQAAWASFVAVSPEQYQFETPQELVNYLCRIANNKVVDVYRQRLQSQKRNINREIPLLDDSDRPVALPGRDPTPSQVLMADERWEALTSGLPPPLQEALRLLREGHTHVEIADRVGIKPKTLQRLLQRLRSRENE